MSKIVIIGFGSAGYAALMAARKADPSAEFTVIDPKAHDLFHPCGMPYSLEGTFEKEKLVQDLGLERMKVLRVRAEALKIDPLERTVQTSDSRSIPYDKVIIAAGALPLIPPLPGLKALLGCGINTLASMDDLEAVSSNINAAASGIVIGAGAIGLESAAALKAHMSAVTVFEMQKNVLPGVLDPDMAKLVSGHLSALGIDLRCETAVDRVLGSEAFEGVEAGDEKFAGDIGILSTGFSASTALAESSGIDFTKHGIAVSSKLETSLPDVYACGDCISNISVIDGQPIAAKLATSAYKQGEAAGANAAGGDINYRGSAGTFVTKIGGLEIAGTGFTAETCAVRGFNSASGKIRTSQLPDYFPNADEISIKIIADRETGRILGAQAVGKSGAASRINLISAAIEFSIPLADFKRTELAYCPAVSEVEDPIFKAADFCLRRMR